ncbi:hypothetical protein C2G38_1138777 [Gigaspora rosea]|uniref:Uncharacterized protein n=1 Tax=Gigaspora rosea TaxID=44941 RepID=A0A397VGC0_9GLOM|nr:hypothetical protein C2G38_1138777 [Gigaspora rosea]CAG8460684.1 9528_t:CDS:1 [Gigaspora rosea]
MLKTRSTATFITLFAFIFTYLHATPLHLGGNFLKEFLNATTSPDAAIGDKVVAIFKELDGIWELKQTDINSVELNFVLNKGITENDPNRYFIDNSKDKTSFATLKIPIDPPKAGPVSGTLQGDVNNIIGITFTIYMDNNILDSATFDRE